MIAYRNFLFLIGMVCFFAVNVGAGICPRVKSKFCTDIDGLGYDRTFFPNVLGHEDQREAKEALKQMEPLAKTECSPYISAFLCAAYLPACPVWKDNPKKAQKPCRELCETARKDCEGVLWDRLGIAWPAELNCDNFPTYDKSRRNPACTNYQPPRPDNTSTIAPATTQTDGGASDVTMMSSPSKGEGDAKSTKVTTMASGTAGSETHSVTGSMTSSPESGQTDGSMDVSPVQPGRSSRPTTSMVQPSDGSTAKPIEGGSPSQTSRDGTDAPDAVSTSSPVEDGTTQGMTSTMMFSTESYRTTKEPDGLPVIVNNLDNQVVITGGSVEFRCIARGATEYSWKRVDGEYPMEKVDMEDYDRIQGAVLRMVDLAPEDAGIYACVASNADGYVEALVTLTIVVAPTIETIETPQFVSEGDRLEIECIGDGVPPPTMLWERKNGKKVRSKGGSRSKRTLVIKNASPSDAGIYYCIAVNQAGHANYTVEVQIETGVEIVDDIRSQTIMENETAFFVCSATGNPVPQFSWRRLDGEFPDESRVVIEGPILNRTLGYPIYSSILGIEPAFGSDTGSYQCYAFNSVGNYTAVGDLTVVGVPGFSQKPVAEQSLSVGDSAYFTCIGAGAPPYDITWSKEGDPDWPEGDRRVILEDDNTFLKINDVVPEDSDVYVCVISNEFGMVSASSNLQVDGGDLTTALTTEGGDVGMSETEIKTELAESMETSMPGSPMTDGSSMAPGTVTMGSPMSGEATVSEGMESSEPTDVTDAPKVSPETQGSTETMGSPESPESTEPTGSPETHGSTEPMASPETKSSTESMASPEPRGSPEPESSTEPGTEGPTMGMTSGPTKGGDTDSPMLTNTPGMVSTSTMAVSKEMTSQTTKMMSSKIGMTGPPDVKQRRTDITHPGIKDQFSGWVDVQGQGAANDFCRIIEKDKGEYQLACSLAGMEGEDELNFVSRVGFDIGDKDTFYMKDENGDGRDDYCRCTAKNGRRYVWCTAAGENGFYGNEKDEPGTDEHSFEANGPKSELKKCRRRFVDPFFGIPYNMAN
ncbi:Basement membrane-specific heparan sulfate proteoglycan core protein [Holothuria leucospilota]|uniref:Basement membrane-specific heparan sulfate proteoglycan core protein n=1 Tax=Holothuria leucospilota TaxID=206669 RepID=A0A9Q0YKK3_HOLLE|nr:Basement membrane-specific heparan sulfate proteoglycan core protein [Holothuria leucospilota]